MTKQLDYQADVNRRDRKIEVEMMWHKKSRRKTIPISILNAVRDPPKIRDEEELVKDVSQPTRPRNQPIPVSTQTRSGTPPIIDICEISANALHFNMKRPGTEFFQTSLYEIDRLITDFGDDELEDEETEQLLDQRLPTKHYKFYDVFSKV